MATRILSVGYVKDAELDNYNLEGTYALVSAKDSSITPDPELLKTGVDLGLMKLHIHNAPERRKFLGLMEDRKYEIMVTLSPLHVHPPQPGGTPSDVLKVKYGKFFDVEKEKSAGGFTYKPLFTNLRLKGSLSLDVQLTEIDNEKVDPDGLEVLLNDTGVGKLLDLAPYNPKDYLLLASNIISRIQEVFGSDKAGDDPLWDDTLSIEPRPTIPGSYRLRPGFYAIVEGKSQTDFSAIQYKNNTLINKSSKKEIKRNYLLFGVGKCVPIE